MECLIKNTSAHIVVGSHGCLLISGLTEQVVQAYSLITDLLERFQGSQDQCTATGGAALGKSLDFSRAFNCLVRKWDDKHKRELLALPEAVKQSLLTLVKESGLESSPGSVEGLNLPAAQDAHCTMTGASARLGRESGDIVGAIASNSHVRPGPDGAREPDGRRVHYLNNVAPATTPAVERPSRGLPGAPAGDLRPWDALVPPEPTATVSERRGGGAGDGTEQPLVRAPQELEEEVVRLEAVKGEEQEEEEEVGEEERLLSTGSRKEFMLLVKFFAAMGYTEQVVRRVLARTGLREASEILDLVQQEQDRSDKNPEHGDPTGKDPSGRNMTGGMGKEEPREAAKTVGRACGGHLELLDPTKHSQHGPQTGGAMAVRRKCSRDEGDGEQEEDIVLTVIKKAAVSCGYTEETVEEVYKNLPVLSTHQLITQLQGAQGALRGHPKAQTTLNARKQSVTLRPTQPLAEVRGPPLLTYPSADLSPVATANHLPPVIQKSKTSAPPPHVPYINPQPHNPQPYLQTPGHRPPTGQHSKTPNPLPYTYPQPHPPHQPPHLPSPKPAPAPVLKPKDPPQVVLTATLSTGTLVTGEQRFLEGLRKTFDLQLPDDPGDHGLRMIIIDGSNVAMSHGLGHFFSCRGIALAVQHFWNRGHRRISTFLPQFMLQLAQQSDGVIVTNDNLRDLLDESLAWKDIIKKRLLQYTFVGDLFMVPDDPLGRGGPHLDHFLRSEHRTPDLGSHSFAGFNSSFPSSKLPRAKTEVMQYRDLTPGGAALGRAASPGQGTSGGAAGPGGVEAGPERGVDETTRLRESLCQVFPGQDSAVGLVLQQHPTETDINFLSHVVLEQQGG
ncbi:hypothetical protein CRUP_014700 [Coryphaenoides rupestris]|nr:hypothetical protein CRUP_014700 [Coryphaenoides rupestris]